MTSVKCTVKVASPQKSLLSAQFQATVKSRYSVDGDVICPISKLNIAKMGENVDHSHIIPKNLRAHYPGGVLDGPDNIIPTFSVLHRQMELHQHRPSISFKFVREDNVDYDLYELLFSRGIGNDHIVFRYIQHKELVRLHQSSRSFLCMHQQVFMECDAISVIGVDNLLKIRDDLRQTHVRTAVTKSIVNAMIARQSRTIKSVSASSKKVSETTILAWIESESIIVSGTMWEYGEGTVVPDEVVCRMLQHNKTKDIVDFICVDDYSDEQVKYFMSKYNPKSSIVPKDLVNYTIWKMNSSHFQNHVLRVVQKDRESGKIIGTDDDDGPFPVGTITYNYLNPVGFHPLRVDTFDSKTSLTKVTVADNSENDQVYHLTCSQVDNLVRGNLKSETIKQLVGRCFVVQSSTNEPKIAQLVSATYGRAEVHWLDRVNVGSASRPRSWVDDKYAPVWEERRGKHVVCDIKKSKKWNASISWIPFTHLHGLPFDLHQEQIPSSVIQNMPMSNPLDGNDIYEGLGVQVMRRFGSEDYEGVVTAVFPSEDWRYHVVYEDGDSEDMTTDERNAAVMYRKKRKRVEEDEISK